ncbi:unnamed protein product, partial [Cladocopium goreaui]
MPTPHVSSQMVEAEWTGETFANSAKTVRIFPAADVEAIPVSGEGRSTRERIATPFMKDLQPKSEDDELFEDARSVHFSTEASTLYQSQVSRGSDTRPSFGAVEEIQMEIAPDHRLRTSRERMDVIEATSQSMVLASGVPWDAKMDSPTDSTERHVRISLAAHVEAVPLTGGRRPSRDRIPTPFFKEQSPVEERAVQFNDGDEVSGLEIETEIPADSMMRRSRYRIATPHVRLDFMEAKSRLQLEPGSEEPKHVRISNAADIEAIPISGERRPSRDRIPTPFVKEDIAVSGDCRGVQFNDTATTADLPRESHAGTLVPWTGAILSLCFHLANSTPIEMLAREDVTVGSRSVHDRLPTPYASAREFKEVSLGFIEVELRSLKSRIPRALFDRAVTGLLLAGMGTTAKESFTAFQKSVRVLPTADVEVEIEAESSKEQLRSSRD